MSAPSPAPAIGFWRSAANDPARVVLIDADGSEITAGALAAAANRVAHGLRARVAPGDTIAVALGARAFLEAYFAAMQVGLRLVPLSSEPSPESPAIIASTGAMLVIGAGGVDPSALAEGQPATPPEARKLGAVVFVTSGTTGTPRALHRPLPDLAPDRASALAARMRLAAIDVAPDDGSVHLAVAPLHHSAALGWCVAHLHYGHRVVLAGAWSAERTLALIERHRVTSAFMVPTHFRRLLALPPAARAHDLRSLRALVHGGAPCPVDLKRAMIDWLGPVLTEVYGAAELSTGTSVGADDWLAHPGTVGRAGAHVRVVRSDGSPCAAGEIGEITLAGESAGDLGYVDEGWLYLTDRKSDVIITGGVNVHPGEVEAALATHPEVADVAVIGLPDPEWGERVVAVVAPIPTAERAEPLRAELLAMCRSHLAAHKCPRAITFSAAIPRDELGKLRRRELRPQWR